jgi:K+-sensing histidine kinase KdpD
MNAVEAMSDVSKGSRDFLISTAEDISNGVLVTVRDSGPGLNPESLERLFDPFGCHFAAEFTHNPEPFVLRVLKFVSSLRH